MENNKPISPGVKEDRQKLEKVVTGGVSVKQKKGSKIAKAFFGDEEEIHEIKDRVLFDTIIPTIKDIFLDSLATLLGVNRSRFSSSGRRVTADRVSYGRYYEDSKSSSRPSVRTVTAFNTDDVVFDQNGDAEYVLDRMFEMLERYGVVRVTDFYDLAGVSVDYTASKYGWNSLKNTRVVRTRDGYVVDLPRAMPID